MNHNSMNHRDTEAQRVSQRNPDFLCVPFSVSLCLCGGFCKVRS